MSQINYDITPLNKLRTNAIFDCWSYTAVFIFPHSVIGTSSLRRSAQLKRAFPHLFIEDVVSFCETGR